MNVYKFGGASINSVERFKNTADIIRSKPGEKYLVVISAMGKTTNALEKVAEAFFENRRDDALMLFERIKHSHLDLVKYLLTTQWQNAENRLKDIFTEVEWMLHDKPVREFDYYYDQVVCTGELMSSSIMSALLDELAVPNAWVDVRDILRTDDNFRDAAVDWDYTSKKTNEIIKQLFNDQDIIITQGYIGATDENESTTLGREGSDFTAAIFANLLDAEGVTIWKDVEAVMNADPRNFKDAVIIPALSYTEVIEMAYYGAQVIHPKTIKPLQNKKIPLYVKSFLDPTLPGTIINEKPAKNMPPVIVKKQHQVLITFRTKDFSFMEDEPVNRLHNLFHELRVKSNLSQHTAISLICCFDEHPEKTGQMAASASEFFDVTVEKDLTLITIRHHNDEIRKAMMEGKTIILEQRTPVTMQAVMRESET